MNNVRNFCIIAHIDHGKSTLADRLLEMTRTVEKRKMKEQLLDQMDLERERGITIKLQPARMLYQHSCRGNMQNETQKDAELLYEDLTYKIRGAVFEVRKKIGLGHKESVYHKALEIAFEKQKIYFKSETVVPIFYEGKKVGSYQPDFIIDDKIIVELKALPEISRPQQEQIWSYLKGSEYKLALLVNFGNKDLEIKRIVFDTAREGGNLQRSSASVPRDSAGVLNQVENYILNLIDTPGHVDFGYEVSRSLAAVEGAVLLVDATKGVQAQTLSNLYQAIEQGLEIIPVVNKVDLPNANVSKTKQEIIHILGCKEEEILEASGKTGIGVDKILEAIVEKVPAPRGEKEKPLRALIFDSKYDTYKGVLAYVRIVDGEVRRDSKILMMANQTESSVVEVGYFKPELSTAEFLTAGDIGYIATGLKSVEHCRVGDTITLSRTVAEKTRNNAENNVEKIQRNSASVQRDSASQVIPLPGYKEVKPMVYAGFYPIEGDTYNLMRDSLEKLKLNDAAFVFEPESNLALGKGFRCGFLGLLHLEIIKERLEREFNFSPTITTPSVVYEIKLKGSDEIKKIYSTTQMPDPSFLEDIAEPYVKLDIVTPAKYLGAIMELMSSLRSIYKNTEYIDMERILLTFEVPLMDIIVNFHDDLKSVSSGYASMSYELIGYRSSDLIKMDILLGGEMVEALSRIVPRSWAHREGKRIVEKLKDAIPRQNFVIPVQAALGGKIIARETIRPYRKDVIAKLYGGDVTRKNKLLDKQKKGKKKMQGSGKVKIPSEAYLAVLKR
ncbi:MAG TPA: GxxExxY protein [Candidatus Moranbacteria bacterium]|nr:GxxExxY protein [Candidatus Moranbacteria bacterium]